MAVFRPAGVLLRGVLNTWRKVNLPSDWSFCEVGSIGRFACSGLHTTVAVEEVNRQSTTSDETSQRLHSEGQSAPVPFLVNRSKTGNLPVYLDYKSGRTKVVTIIRKIEGDVSALEQMLRENLNDKNLLSRVDEVVGSVSLHGNHREKVKELLLKLGF